MKIIKLIKNIKTDKDVEIDIVDIIDRKMIIHANTKGGKSMLCRKAVEEIIIKHNDYCQVILISPKPEFDTLTENEKINILTIGKNKSDNGIIADINNVDSIVEMVLSKHVHCYLDMSGIVNSGAEFVGAFLNRINNMDTKYYRPMIVIIDEARIYAPEHGKIKQPSLEPINELVKTGSDKGVGVILATQRLAELSNDVISQIGIKFCGYTELLPDLKKSQLELRLSNEQRDNLTKFGDPHYHFYLRGIGPELLTVKSNITLTEHMRSWLKYNNHIPVSDQQSVRDVADAFEQSKITKPIKKNKLNNQTDSKLLLYLEKNHTTEYNLLVRLRTEDPPKYDLMIKNIKSYI